MKAIDPDKNVLNPHIEATLAPCLGVVITEIDWAGSRTRDLDHNHPIAAAHAVPVARRH